MAKERDTSKPLEQVTKDLAKTPYKDREYYGTYVLREGLHNEGGETYEPGQAFRSKCNLDRWPEKFHRIDEKTGLPEGLVTNLPPGFSTKPPEDQDSGSKSKSSK